MSGNNNTKEALNSGADISKTAIESRNSAATPSAQQIPNQRKVPFGDPVYLLGRNMKSLSQKFKVPLNQAGNLVIDTTDSHLLVESSDGVNATYVALDLKELGICT